MSRRVAVSVVVAGLVAAGVGALGAGCGGARVQVPFPAPGTKAGEATLAVANSASVALEVQFAGGVVGTVPPGSAAELRVGVRTGPLLLRPVNELTPRYQGDYALVDGARVSLAFEPGVTFTLEVLNTQREGLHVLVDNVEIGQVPVGWQRDFLVTPGQRALAVRKQFETRLIPLGNYDFVTGSPPLRVVF